MKYKEKLLDARWKKKRDSIVDRDGGICRHCQSLENLEVHHCYYDSKEPWEYEEKSLITLCRNCHEFETIYLNQMKKMLCDVLSRKGATANNFEQLSFAFDECCIWPEDKTAWLALSWAIKTPAIMNVIIEHYEIYKENKNVSI